MCGYITVESQSLTPTTTKIGTEGEDTTNTYFNMEEYGSRSGDQQS